MVFVGANFIFIACGSIVSNVFIQLCSILRRFVVGVGVGVGIEGRI